MSKNPQKKQGNKKGNKTVLDQQNEPIFKAINKRVRNINKKLNQISQLQTKESLKPEQLEKINKKEKTLQEKSKLQEFLTMYRQTVTENIQSVRQYQKRDLANLAQALSLHNAGSGPSNPQVTAIYKVITGKSNANLDQRADSLTNLLNQFADDKNIQQWIEDGKAGKLQQKTKQKPKQKNKQQKKSEEKSEKTEEPKKQQPVELTAVKIAPLPPVVQQKPVASEAVVEEVKTEKVQSKTVQQTQPAAQKSKQQRKQRPRRQRDPNKPIRNNQDGKRRYKPKNEEKMEENKEEGDNDDESEQQAPVERNKFTQKDVQQLHDEGFIVIGKPKVKPQSRQDRDQFYGKTHGRKQFHNHGTKNDY